MLQYDYVTAELRLFYGTWRRSTECGNFCSLDIIDTMASESGRLQTLRLSNYLRYYFDDFAVGTGIEDDVWARLEWKANQLRQ